MKQLVLPAFRNSDSFRPRAARALGLSGLKINRKAKTSSFKGHSMNNHDSSGRYSEQEMDYLAKLLSAMPQSEWTDVI